MRAGIVIAGAFLAGVGTGYLVARQFLEGKYGQMAQEEIDDIKEYYRSKSDPDSNGLDIHGIVRIVAEPDDSDIRLNRTAVVRSSLDNNPYERAKKAYHLVGKSPGPEEIEDEEEEMVEPEEEEPEIDKEHPYMITIEDFSIEQDAYDKISLSYYTLDSTLCDEDDAMLDDVDHTIGNDAFRMLITGEARSTLYVRNEKISCDYEIAVIHKAYLDLIEATDESSKRRRRPHEDDEIDED